MVEHAEVQKNSFFLLWSQENNLFSSWSYHNKSSFLEITTFFFHDLIIKVAFARSQPIFLMMTKSMITHNVTSSQNVSPPTHQRISSPKFLYPFVYPAFLVTCYKMHVGLGLQFVCYLVTSEPWFIWIIFICMTIALPHFAFA